jgi:pSer/pThr/pTyr-binding forkhead associated (FHA) protein
MADFNNNSTSDEASDTLHDPKKHKLKSSGLYPRRAVLLVVSENFFGAAFVIGKSETFVGRSEKCEVCINDPHISSQHCIVTDEGDGKYFIEDLDSTNSTYINRKELKKKVQLLYGDRIVIGKTIVRFFVEEKIDEQ